MCIIYSILTIKYAREKNVIMKIVRFVSYCCKSPKVFPIIIEKYPCVSGPMQFKLVLFKSQLYCTQLKRLVAWKVNCYLIVCCGMQEKSQNIAEYWNTGREGCLRDGPQIRGILRDSLGRFSMINMFIMIMLRALSSLGSPLQGTLIIMATHSSTSISAEEGLLSFWANWD